MEKFDAIVVGAGPAGSTAAYRLARSGAKVLLLDRARFPRDKPCGGGLTERAVTQLPVSVDPVVEEVVDRFELGFRYGTRFVRGGERPLVLMTRRSRLDAHLVAEAAAAGADFRDGLRATALNLDEAGATVRFDGTAASAPVVIGADGVNGLTARARRTGFRTRGSSRCAVSACRCVGRVRLRSAAERCWSVTRRASSTRSPETGSTRRY